MNVQLQCFYYGCLALVYILYCLASVVGCSHNLSHVFSFVDIVCSSSNLEAVTMLVGCEHFRGMSVLKKLHRNEMYNRRHSVTHRLMSPPQHACTLCNWQKASWKVR